MPQDYSQNATTVELPERRQRRASTGNTIALVIGFTLFLLIGLVIFAIGYIRLTGGSLEHNTAIEAASLAAATDISRIVIADDNYGFIGLSDFPPTGRATLAADGEPLPVEGINSIMATARLDMLIADNLSNATMKSLAHQDAMKAKAAAQHLASVLQAALTEEGSAEAKDLDGNPITPYQDALSIYNANQVQQSGGLGMVAGTFKLTLGFLASGSSTLTPLPQPESEAEVPPNQQLNGCYKAFVNIPAGGENYYFAGLDRRPILVDSSQFQAADGVNTSSVVRAEASHWMSVGQDAPSQQIHSLACAQPPGNDNPSSPGVMSISFPAGPPPGIDSPSSIATDPQLKTNKTRLFSPQSSDWPGETTSALAPTDQVSNPTPSVAQAFSAGMYHWLRSTGKLPNISDVSTLASTTFNSLGDAGSMTNLSNYISLNGAAFGEHALCQCESEPLINGNWRGWLQSAWAEKSSLRSKNSLAGLVFSNTYATDDTDPDRDPRISLLKTGGDDPRLRKGYFSMASLESPRHTFPQNTLMVAVDPKGNILSADGKNSLTESDLELFISSILKSNAAGRETMRLAKQATNVVTSAIDGQLQEINKIKEEIKASYASLGSLTKDRDRRALKKEIHAKVNSLPALEQKLATLQAAMVPAQTAYNNGAMVASISDTIARNLRGLTSRGLSPLSGGKFMLSGQILTPRTIAPVSSAALSATTTTTTTYTYNSYSPNGVLSSTTSTTTPLTSLPPSTTVSVTQSVTTTAPSCPSSASDSLNWTDPNLSFFNMPTVNTDLASTSEPTSQVMYLYQMKPDGHIKVTVLPSTPFKNIRVSHKQNMAICYHALKTGNSQIPATWTMTMRDETAHRGLTKGGAHAGRPLAGAPFDWCENASIVGTTDSADDVSNHPERHGFHKESGNFHEDDGEADNTNFPNSFHLTNADGKLVRKSHYCGGLATDFQLRSPLLAPAQSWKCPAGAANESIGHLDGSSWTYVHSPSSFPDNAGTMPAGDYNTDDAELIFHHVPYSMM